MALKLAKAIPSAHDESIWSVACTDTHIVTGSLDETVRVWSLEDFLGEKKETDIKATTKFESHRLGVVSVDAFNNLALSASMDGTTRIYDLNLGEEIESVEVGSLKQWTVSHHSSRKLFVTGTHSGQVNFVDYSGEVAFNPVDVSPGSFLMSAKFNRSGSLVGAGSWDGSLALLDTESAQIAHKIANGHHKAVRSIDFSKDVSHMFTGSEDHYVGVFDARSSQKVASVSVHQGWVLGVRGSPENNNLCATCSTDGSIKLLDARKNFEVISSIQNAHSGQVWAISFTQDGSALASAGEDSALKLFSIS
jgi:WD40 repeat protein